MRSIDHKRILAVNNKMKFFIIKTVPIMIIEKTCIELFLVISISLHLIAKTFIMFENVYF